MKALNLPPDVTVTHANINKVKKTIKGVRGLDPTQKLLKGDTLTLNAAVHRLAAVAEVKNGALSLALSSKSAQADAEALEKGRTLLLTVANKIAIWLQGAVRAEVGLLARALPRASHAVRLSRLGVVFAYLFLVARASARAVVRTFCSLGTNVHLLVALARRVLSRFAFLDDDGSGNTSTLGCVRSREIVRRVPR